MKVWKIMFLSKWVICMGSMLIFQGVIHIAMPVARRLPKKSPQNVHYKAIIAIPIHLKSPQTQIPMARRCVFFDATSSQPPASTLEMN